MISQKERGKLLRDLETVRMWMDRHLRMKRKMGRLRSKRAGLKTYADLEPNAWLTDFATRVPNLMVAIQKGINSERAMFELGMAVGMISTIEHVRSRMLD